MSKRRRHSRGSNYGPRLFAAVAAFVLPHRLRRSEVVGQLVELVHEAKRRRSTPYFTHTTLAAWRGVQHRNTSRAIIRELEECGLVKCYGYRAHHHEPSGRTLGNTRFRVLWKAVFELRDTFDIHPMRAMPGGDRPRPRSEADWRAEREAWHKRREEARAADERRKADAATWRPAEPSSRLEAVRGHLQTLERLLSGKVAGGILRMKWERRRDELQAELAELLS